MSAKGTEIIYNDKSLFLVDIYSQVYYCEYSFDEKLSKKFRFDKIDKM